MIRFTSSKDGFFEKASGGAEKVEAGARFFLCHRVPCDTRFGCWGKVAQVSKATLWESIL
jgi:hypothetical protein